MDIKSLATKPKLIRLELDSPEIVEQYEEPIVFYMHDHLALNTYFEFYKLQQNQDVDRLVDLIKSIIKDSDGNAALEADQILPVDVTLAILYKVNDYLGKLGAKESTKELGAEQK
jgi:hypothetical protein